jgi:predicted nuclease with TOPRIM domain
MAQLNLSLDHMMMEKDIDIHNLQLSRLSEQMNHLNSQIQAIENQKAELQQKVDAELKAISDLRLRQSEITDKASHIK